MSDDPTAMTTWLSIAIDVATLFATAAIAWTAHRFTKQQLTSQSVTAFLDQCERSEKLAISAFGKISSLGPSDLAKIHSDPALQLGVTTFLNHCEIFCNAVVNRHIDPARARELAQHAIPRTFAYYKQFIVHTRSNGAGAGAWSELERTAETWSRP